MTNNKRRAKRISVQFPVSVCLFDKKRKSQLGGLLDGLINNFSPAGAALTVATILIDGQHLFYACHDNPDIVLELVFELGGSPEKIITVQAVPVWFDRKLGSDTKQFVVGIKFLMSAKSQEIKALSNIACKDENLLAVLWKKLF